MLSFFNHLFDSESLVPHGICLLWRPELIWLHVLSDSVTALAYFSIPVVLAAFVSKRPDVQFGWVFWAFAMFIMACGTTHIFGVWTLWFPDYAAEGVVKAVTAVASIVTAIGVWPLLPKALALPSTEQLKNLNEALIVQIDQRDCALQALEHERQRRIESECRQAEEKFRLAVEACPNGMVMADNAGRIVMANAEIERMFGYSRQELIGQSIDILVPSRTCPMQPQFRSEFVAHPQSRIMGEGRELSGLHKAGNEFPVEVRLNPIETTDGLMVLNVIVDVSERRRVDAEKKIAQEQFRLAVEACPSGMVMVDRAGQIVMANAEIERMFGYARQELIGQSIDILVPPRARATHPQFRSEFVASPGTRAMGVGRDLSGLRKDGREFPVEVALNPIETSTGLVVLSVIVDISERKAAEQALAQQTKELQRSNAELEEFAYVAAHDLQEPLRMIASYTELLCQRYEGRLDEKADKYIHYAVDGAKRMQRLINDLLTYSRVGTPGKPPQPIQSGAVLSRVLQSMRDKLEEAQADVVCGVLPMVRADETQLGQLFQNLISNALKFRSERLPRIKLGAVDRNGEWIFSVEDNGIGIDRQYADRIFQMFQRLHERGKYEGSGIGLAIAKKIVQRHGGRIWFESLLGAGTTFYFTLPDVRGVIDEYHSSAND
jgi:PAS domain S-box-containing protein